ncbi:MAG: polysaccharide biosynthesis/export family protein, partial [Pyrinomonadaceae bacterium]
MIFAFGASVIAQSVSNPASATASTNDGVKVQKIAAAVATDDEDRYRIGFLDTIEIQVVRHPELSVRTGLYEDGTVIPVRLPVKVLAVCKTENELSREIENAYRKEYLRNPQVNVTVVEQNSQSFAVIGAVEKPGRFFIKRKPHLLELLAFAGGPAKEAGT